MGLFSRIKRNILRGVQDVAPIVQIAAPFVAPGLGGLIASQLAARVRRSNSPTRNSATAIARGGPIIRPTCPRRGVVGGGFSAPWNARNFISGGSFPGRSIATRGGRVPVGRDITSRFCPTPAPEVPVVTTPQRRFSGISPGVSTFSSPRVPAVVRPPPKVAPIPSTRIRSSLRRGINTFTSFR